MVSRQRLRSFIRFGLVGVANNGFAYAVFLLLVEIGLPPVAASGLCYCLGLATGYFANRHWSFEAKSAHAQDIPRYIVAYLIGFVFALASIWTLLIWLSPAVAQLICIVATAFVVFGSLVVLRFGERGRHADQTE